MAINNATFASGIHMEDYKSLTSDKAIGKASPPERVTIALSQHIGVSCEPIVEVGDRVLVGQKIGEGTAAMSVPVHSSVSGQVVEIVDLYKADGGKSKAIVIESDGLDELGYEEKSLDYENLSKEEILNYIKEAGLVGLGGAAFPTHIKLNPPSEKTIDTVLVNGAECEPFLTADQKIMEEASEEIIKGLEIVLKVLDAPRAIICIEDNKPGAIAKMRQASASSPKIEVASLKTKYPQGDERMMIRACLDREVPRGGLPMDVGVVVINAYSVKTIYDALYKNKPLYERIVTLTGSGLNQPQNVYTKIGVSLEYLVKQAGGLKDTVKKVIVGGPMMGTAQFDMSSPTVKATGGVIALEEDQARVPAESACIGCVRCVDACPMKLQPHILNKLVRHEAIAEARDAHIGTCMQCGSCTYVCPAKINLAETIKIGMAEAKRLRSTV